jgi:AMP-polyphosphate phosphotransferase
MLEKIDLGRKMSKEEYKQRLPKLQERLFALQKDCWDKRIPSIVIFEGWSASGKGSTINLLTEQLEPRVFKLHGIRPPRTLEQHMPWLWRFWLKLPNYGEMAIFDQSWYRRVLVDRIERVVPKKDWKKAPQDIFDFERALADDRHVIIKFFFHISREEQTKRFRKLGKDPLAAMLLEPEDHLQHKHYKKYQLAVEEMLERTEAEWAPWTIVEATDRQWTRVRVYETIIARLQDAVARRNGGGTPGAPGSSSTNKAA